MFQVQQCSVLELLLLLSWDFKRLSVATAQQHLFVNQPKCQNSILIVPAGQGVKAGTDLSTTTVHISGLNH